MIKFIIGTIILIALIELILLIACAMNGINHVRCPKKINIAEILKNAPKGLELYSPLFGYVKLWKSSRIPAMIELNNDFPIRVETSSSTIDFDEYGRPAMYRSPECECMLFPSKENRDWSTFKASWYHKTFKPLKINELG